MRRSLEKLWTLLFVGLVQLPVAAVVGTAVGKTDLAIWVMGIVAHQVVRSARDLSLGRRVAFWLIAMMAGVVAVVLGTGATNALMPAVAGAGLVEPGQATNAFWTVVGVRVVIGWIPVIVTWVVSEVLVRHPPKRGQDSSSPNLPLTQAPKVLGAQRAAQSPPVGH